MRKLFYNFVSIVVLGALISSVHSQPPTDKEAIAAPTVKASSSGCGSASLPPQRITLEMSPPEVIIQQAHSSGHVGKTCLQRCGHFFHRHCNVGGTVGVMSVPYAAAPVYAQPSAFAAVQPMAMQTFAYQPTMVQSAAVAPMTIQSLSVPSFGMQSFSAAPFSVQSLSATPFSVQPFALNATSVAQPTIQLQVVGPDGRPLTADGARTFGTDDKSNQPKDLNNALRRIDTALNDLISIADRHTTILVDHEKRLRTIETHLDKLNPALKIDPLKGLNIPQFEKAK